MSLTLRVSNEDVLIDEDRLAIFESRKWYVSDNGYAVWRGHINGKKQTIRLHRLIAKAKPGEIVDHINRNKLDNRTSNLRIVDAKTNILNSDRVDNAKSYYFDSTKNRWAVDSKRLGVRSLYMDSEEDCKQYILQLEAGKRPERKLTRRPSLGGRKISDEQVDYIFSSFSRGRTRTSIAEELGVSLSTVGRIISGRTTMGGTLSRKTQ